MTLLFERHPFRRWLGAATAILAGSLIAAATVAADDLQRQLNVIAGKWGLDEVANAECDCLALLARFETPSSKGRIYAFVAMLYTNAGLHRGVNSEKAVEYCRKALQCPLAVTHACRTYLRLGEALSELCRNMSTEETPAARREAAKAFLMGLALLVENQVAAEARSEATDEWFLDPRVPDAILRDDREEIERIKAAYRAARERRREQEELAEMRRPFIEQCVQLYARGPDDSQELVEMARETVKQAGIVAEIIAELEKATGKRLEVKGAEPSRAASTSGPQTDPLAGHSGKEGRSGEHRWVIVVLTVCLVLSAMGAAAILLRSRYRAWRRRT